MPRKTPPNSKSASKSNEPMLPPNVTNMLNDLQVVVSNAVSIVKVLKKTELNSEHLLMALLLTDKFHPYLERLFARHHLIIDEVSHKLMGELLAENKKSNDTAFNADKLRSDARLLLGELESWVKKQPGYCLPPLFLRYLLTTPKKTLAATRIKGFGITGKELLGDLDRMNKTYPEDLSALAPQDKQEQQDDEIDEEHAIATLQEFEASANSMKQDLYMVANITNRIALQLHHAYLLPEHLFLAFLKAKKFESYSNDLFQRRHHASLKELKEQLEQYMDVNVEKLKDNRSPEITPAYGRVVTQVIRQLKSLKVNCFPPMFLLGLLQVDCFASMLLRQVLFNSDELLRDVKRMAVTGPEGFAAPIPPDPADLPKNEEEDQEEEDLPFSMDQDDMLRPASTEMGGEMPWDENSSGEDSGSALENFAIELVELARQGKIDPMIGRQAELERLLEILHKKRSSNALIVGNEGVGKTAIVEGLALRIAKGKVPSSIRDYKIYALNLGAMVAGSELRGAFERRLEQCIKEIIAQPKCFLFIDEIHSILGAGTGRDGTLDASNIIKPYLARGEIRCIGATTYDEYQRRILSDRAFARRFMKIDLAESTEEETFQILKGLANSYEKYHGVKIPSNILRLIVELSGRLVHEKYFPDKAIEIMDECGARYHCGLAKGTTVTKADVEQVVCRVANLPSLSVQSDESDKLLHLEDNLKKSIFGQDETVAELVRRVKVAKAGFQDPRKPLLSAFLCGSSGCGKTELARQLASELGIAFVKLDMSEYSEEYAASRLVGSAPGYVGYDHPGALTEPVIQTPHCLLLLDEIEKAHNVVFNLLLQVLDEGRLRDNKGREASFRNAIIIMTSNAGSRASSDAINLLGFNKSDAEQSQNRQNIIQRVMRQTFPPEFRNRIQTIMMMNDLNLDTLKQIVEKTLALANQQLSKQKVSIRLTPEAILKIAQQAADEHLGGRPVERLFEEVVKQKLADELLFGKLAKGGQATIDYQKEQFQYHFA